MSEHCYTLHCEAVQLVGRLGLEETVSVHRVAALAEQTARVSRYEADVDALPPRVRIEEATVRVDALAELEEVVEARVHLPQLIRTRTMRLGPVRSTTVAFENRLEAREELGVGHRHVELRRQSSSGQATHRPVLHHAEPHDGLAGARAEPNVVGRDGSDLHREVVAQPVGGLALGLQPRHEFEQTLAGVVERHAAFEGVLLRSEASRGVMRTWRGPQS